MTTSRSYGSLGAVASVEGRDVTPVLYGGPQILQKIGIDPHFATQSGLAQVRPIERTYVDEPGSCYDTGEPEVDALLRLLATVSRRVVAAGGTGSNRLRLVK